MRAFRSPAGTAVTVAIGIGRRRAAAAWRVAGVGDVERLLGELLARLEAAP